MKHLVTRSSLASFFLRPTRAAGIAALTLLLAAFAAAPVSAQPQLVEDAFDSAYTDISLIAEWDQGSTTELCFETLTALDGYELACTDGSTVEQITNIDVNGSSGIDDVVSFQGTLYFSATSTGYGDELFAYDGTSVQRISDINSGSADAYPSDLTVYDGALYFSATGSNGAEVYRYTGSTIERVTDFPSSSTGSVDPRDFVVHDGRLFFATDAGPSYLHAYDGSTTTAVGPLRSDGGDPNIRELTSYRGNLYFSANAGTGNGRQLILYNGSDFFEQFVETFNGNGRSPKDLATYNGYLFYSASTGQARELFRYTSLSNFPAAEDQMTQFGVRGASPKGMTGYDGRVFFRFNDGSTGMELYHIGTSSTSSPTRIDLYPGSSGGVPQQFVVHDGDLYFSATRSNQQGEDRVLHRYDGSTITKVRRSNNLSFGGRGTFGSNKVVYDGDLYFSRHDPSVGEELFRSDGSTVELVEDLNPGANGSAIGDLVRYDGHLYFHAGTPSTGIELYYYDGSSIRLAADIVSGSDASLPLRLTVYNGFLYFAAQNANQDRELYRYSPSTGAQRVENINPSGSAFELFVVPTEFQVYDGDLYFGAQTATHGYELYRSSGVGVTRITDLNPSGNAYPGGFTVYDGILHFVAQNGSDGFELYGYNASSNTVKQVASLNASGDGVSQFQAPFEYDGSLYFSGTDGTNGYELYQYDGFSASLVEDINLGSRNSYPGDFAIYNDRLYFTATTETGGQEPHSYDGQSVQSAEIAPGPVSGGGSDPVVYDDGSGPRLFVTATDNTSGFELYAFDANSAPLPVELATFEGTRDGDSQIRLTWTTASETGNAGFAVQRRLGTSGDAAWTRVGFVEGSGTTQQSQTYRFTDGQLPFEADSLHYRLKQVDTDGTTHLSSVVTVARDAADAPALIGMYPNPAERQVTVRFALPEAGTEARLELYDMMGRRVRTFETGATGGRHERRVSVDGLSSGVYMLRLEAGGAVRSQKVTVVH